jgi:hypothetical protein
MVFIATQALPNFLERDPKGGIVPRMQSPRVPLARWAVQVIVLTAGSLLNNWVYHYHIPLTVQIVFRSAGAWLLSFFFSRLHDLPIDRACAHRPCSIDALRTPRAGQDLHYRPGRTCFRPLSLDKT